MLGQLVVACNRFRYKENPSVNFILIEGLDDRSIHNTHEL